MNQVAHHHDKLALNKVLAYQNQAVLKRFQIDHPILSDIADLVWQDLMRYFWLCIHARTTQAHKVSLAIYPSMAAIDHMWHTFLLFSKDYYDFFIDYLEQAIIHHIPASDETKQSTAEADLRHYLLFIQQHLGDEVLHRWFPIS